MGDPVLSKLYILKPDNAISHVFRENTPSLLPLIKILSRIVSPDNVQLLQIIDDKWRKLPIVMTTISDDILKMSIDSGTKKINIDSFWYECILRLLIVYFYSILI